MLGVCFLKRVVPVVVCLFFFSAHVSAQALWTLEQCVAYALENNLTVKTRELQVTAVEGNLRQSYYGRLPDLNAGATQGFDFGYSVDPYTNQFTESNIRSNSFYLSSSVTLFGGFANHYQIRQNRFNLQSSLEQLERARNDISLNVATLYLQILFNREELENGRHQLEMSRLQTEQTRKLVDAGSLPRSSLLEMEAQLANEELQVIVATNNLEASLLNLAQLLEMKDIQAFDIASPDSLVIGELEIIPQVDEIYAAALGLPQIKAAEYDEQSAAQAVNLARASRYPNLVLSAGYGTGYSDARKRYEQSIGAPEISPMFVNIDGQPQYIWAPTYITTARDYPFADQFVDNRSTSVSLRLTIPLFNKYQITKNIGQAKIGLENSALSLEMAKNQLYKDIQQARQEAYAALNRYSASRKAFEATSESFFAVERRYNLGLVTFVEYSDAKAKQIYARSSVLQAKYEYVFKKNVLLFYMGQPFDI